MRKAFFVISAPQMYGFVAGHSQRLRKIGYKTVILSAKCDAIAERAAADAAEWRDIDIVRDISPMRDAVALSQIALLIARERPEVVLVMGPKANLLGNLAAWLLDVPTRITLYVGIRQETMAGFARWLVDACDRVALSLSTSVLAISSSLRRAMVCRGIVEESHVSVTGNGTTNGIDGDWFGLDRPSVEMAASTRDALGLPRGVPIIGFVGRLTEDKGLIDAWAALKIIRMSLPEAHFLAVGAEEPRSDLGRRTIEEMRADSRVRVVGQVLDVRPYMHISWVHLLPSLREGFGNATAEAAALAVPAVAYVATGVVDSVVSGETGQLVVRGDIHGLASATISYLQDDVMRAKHGLAARRRILSLYHPELTWAGFLPALGHQHVVPHVDIGPDPIEEYLLREKWVRMLDAAGVSRVREALLAGASPPS